MSRPVHACPLDCPDTCSLDIEVREGRLQRISGSSLHPLTDNFICGKVRRFAQHVYGSDRIKRPLMRQGKKGEGHFREVSWDDALTRITEELARVRTVHGPEAILPFSYGGSNGYLTEGGIDSRFFERLGASRLGRTVCAAPSSAAATGLYGDMASVAFHDYTEADLIVIWGSNPHATGIHLVPLIGQAIERGAKLVVVDPRATKLAKRADLHLALRPGTDVVVALSIIRWLFESGHADRDFLERHATGVDTLKERSARWSFRRAAEIAGVAETDLETLARLYAGASPAVIRCGYGPERNRNGGSATAAILALPAVGGKFGVRGGGFTMSQSPVVQLRTERSAAEADSTRSPRRINMNRLGDALLREDPAIRALFVYNANPLSTLPEQNAVRRGLSRDDLFTVVFDSVRTDTARFADVVLPATTFVEHRELRRGYGTGVIMESLPAIDPVGESRPNYEVFAELAHRMKLERPGDVSDAKELAAATLASHPEADRLASALVTDGIAIPHAVNRPVQFSDALPTTGDGRIALVPKPLDAEHPTFLYDYLPDPATDERPLALISPALPSTISSTFGQFLDSVPLHIHPEDAGARGIVAGDSVRVFNDLGEVVCQVKISPELRRGVVFFPKGIWAKSTENGSSSNALVPRDPTDIAGGACFNDARVQVERL